MCIMGNPIRPLVRQFVILLCLVQEVWSRGKMLDPPGRSSLWRQGYDSPVNHHDSQLFCGGYRNVVENAGKCGVCGDPYQGPNENEAGGKYARGIITRHYDVSDKYLNVTIDLAVFRKGYFEFRICPNNDVNTRVKQECLDRYLLHIHSVDFFPFLDRVYPNPDSLIPGSTRYFPKDQGVYNFQLEIPESLLCTQCVLQWKHITGQFWGTAENGTNCQGCGFQETYINCADISIGTSSDFSSEPTHSMKTGPTHSTHISKRTTDVSPQVLVGLNSTNRAECMRCYAVPAWNHYPGMDDWCDEKCREGNCPPCRCYCGCPAVSFQNPCVGVGEERGFQMDTWCWRECCEFDCPADKCQCSVNISQSYNKAYQEKQESVTVTNRGKSELTTSTSAPEISSTESPAVRTTTITDDAVKIITPISKITTTAPKQPITTVKPTVKTKQTTTNKPPSLSSSTTPRRLIQAEFTPVFNDPTNITGYDPTGIPLEGLSSSLFGQFFLSKVTKDIEDILDVPKDTEYLPNNVSSFFKLDDPFQTDDQAVSVSVITINGPEPINGPETTSADPMKYMSVNANTGVNQAFIQTSTSATFASDDGAEATLSTTAPQQSKTTGLLTTTGKPTTTTSTNIAKVTLTTTSKLPMTRIKIPPTTKLPSTTTKLPSTTTKLPATTTAATSTMTPVAKGNQAKTSTTKFLTTRTTFPTTKSTKLSTNTRKQQNRGKYFVPPPPPPFGGGTGFFSKFSKFLGTRKRPRLIGTASSPYTRVHNRGPYTTVSVQNKRLRKTTTTISPYTTARVQNKKLRRTTTTVSPYTTTTVQNKRLGKTTTVSPYTTTTVQNKRLRKTTAVRPYTTAVRPYTTASVQNKRLKKITSTISPYTTVRNVTTSEQNNGLRKTTTEKPFTRARNRRPYTTGSVPNKELLVWITTARPNDVNRKHMSGPSEEQKRVSFITTLSQATTAESDKGQIRPSDGSVQLISKSIPTSVNDSRPTTKSLPTVPPSSEREAKNKESVSTKTKASQASGPSEEDIPDVVPYLIFFPDEKMDKYKGFSNSLPSKLEIKRPKISFRSRKTSPTHIVDPQRPEIAIEKLDPSRTAKEKLDSPRTAKEKHDINQQKFFGNFSSNVNLKLNRTSTKDESSTKIKMREHGPTPHPWSTTLTKMGNKFQGNSSSNFKVAQFNNTELGKDGGKIYMNENLPTFEPYTPSNETNSTDLHKTDLYPEVKNVVHHNFVLNSLIENMGSLLKNGESKIQFLLKGNSERDKGKRKSIGITEDIQLVDSNFIPAKEQGEVTPPRIIAESRDVQSKMAGNQDLSRSQTDAQVKIDMVNTLSEQKEKKQKTAKRKINLKELSAQNVNVFKGNSTLPRKPAIIDTTTSKTVRPSQRTRLRPANQSKDRKVMSALMSLLPPPPPPPIYYKKITSTANPAKTDYPSEDVTKTPPTEVNRAEKKTTIKFPPVPSVYPSNERSPIPAPTPIKIKTTNPTKVTTTTAPTTTTTQITTTRVPRTVTPSLYYPTIPRGLTTTVYKISQIFFPPDFTQRRSLSDIINADPNKVPGAYTKTVYPPTLEQINATDVMLSTPYHVKDSVSKVPRLTSGTTESTVRRKVPGIKSLPRNMKQTESKPSSPPNIVSELEIPDPFTTDNNDLTTQSESPPVFKHANGSALMTNVRKQTKEVKTFRNVGINILKEIFKSPKVKKQDVLSGKVKLPKGKNAVILDIGLMNKIMDTFRRWLTSTKLLVVEK